MIIKEYTTNTGLLVKEYNGMLDIYDAADNAYISEIQNKTLNGYRYNEEVDSDSLDCNIFSPLY